MCDLGAASYHLFYNTTAAKVARSPCYSATGLPANRQIKELFLIFIRIYLIFNNLSALPAKANQTVFLYNVVWLRRLEIIENATSFA